MAAARLMIASREFEVALTAEPAGGALIAETALSGHVPLQLARGESERVVAARIARKR